VISLLIEECKSTQLLIVASARSEFKPHWLDSSNVSRLWLNRLKPAGARTIVDEVAGKNRLPSEAVDLILERADGVPLFIEELTKAIRESSYNESNDSVTSVLRARSIVPMTLDAALVARLDRLEGAKFLAQTAAVIGREFSYSLLVGLWPGSEQELRQALASLVSAQLIHPRGEPPHAVYRFKHALVRDAAYHMLLRSERQQLHLQTGKLLESSDDRIAASQPELIAHHFSEAGASGRAVRYWLAAGKNAIARSANREAVLQLKRGLAEIERLPTNERRAGEELELRLVLLPALIATEGISSADAVDTYKQTLSMNVADESDASLHVLAGHCHVLYFRALHRTALAVAEDLLQRAKRERNPTFSSIAHRMIGQVHNAFGDYRAGQTNCNRAYELAVKIELPEVDPRLISDVLVSACGHSAVSLWHVGEIDESLRREAIALERIGQIRHYQTSGLGAFSRAAATFRRRDFTPLLKYARALRSIGQEQNAPHWTAWGLCMEGIAITHAGDVDQGIMQIENGLDLCRRSDIQLMQPVFMGGLVEAYTVAGRYESASDSLREAFSMSERTEERWMYAEYWRLKGDLALRSNRKKSDAEKAFLRGLAIADEQGSKTHALRLTTALARLLSATRRRQEAVQMLRSRLEALNVTMSVDVPDVKAARVLLDELS
jgi:predicted ATPase